MPVPPDLLYPTFCLLGLWKLFYTKQNIKFRIPSLTAKIRYSCIVTTQQTQKNEAMVSSDNDGRSRTELNISQYRHSQSGTIKTFGTEIDARFNMCTFTILQQMQSLQSSTTDENENVTTKTNPIILALLNIMQKQRHKTRPQSNIKSCVVSGLHAQAAHSEKVDHNQYAIGKLDMRTLTSSDIQLHKSCSENWQLALGLIPGCTNGTIDNSKVQNFNFCAAATLHV